MTDIKPQRIVMASSLVDAADDAIQRIAVTDNQDLTVDETAMEDRTPYCQVAQETCADMWCERVYEGNEPCQTREDAGK